MSISGISSTTDSSQTNATSGFRQQMQDFKSLSDALQSGDISGAQSALATLQTDLKSAQASGKTSPLLDPNTTVGKDFQALQTAVQSGNVSTAQSAFATLKTDVRSAGHAHGHHHHAKSGQPTSSTTSTSASATTESSDATSSALDLLA